MRGEGGRDVLGGKARGTVPSGMGVSNLRWRGAAGGPVGPMGGCGNNGSQVIMQRSKVISDLVMLSWFPGFPALTRRGRCNCGAYGVSAGPGGGP